MPVTVIEEPYLHTHEEGRKGERDRTEGQRDGGRLISHEQTV